jgi:hypothetical protein
MRHHTQAVTITTIGTTKVAVPSPLKFKADTYKHCVALAPYKLKPQAAFELRSVLLLVANNANRINFDRQLGLSHHPKKRS